MPRIVLYDACVLYPAPLRDLLMQLALTDLFRARWSDAIHDECTRFLEGYKGTLTRFDREGLEHYRRHLPAAGAREKLPA